MRGMLLAESLADKRTLLVTFVTLSLMACSQPSILGDEFPPAKARVERPNTALVVAHGGQGSPAAMSEGPALAVEAVLAALEAGRTPTEAAATGIELLEDDPRYNAGTGANLRLDGRTIQCDAAIMDDSGRFGSVAGLAGIRHPIAVARAVMDSPHVMLAGGGAQRFAETLGVEHKDLATDRAHNKHALVFNGLLAGNAPEPHWQNYDWRKHWNFESPLPGETTAPAELAGEPIATLREAARQDEADPPTKDTVGVVLRTAKGRYVAALSTGGTMLALDGRVGDVPMLAAGLFAGPHGAVAATGFGEAIVRARVAGRVYDRLAAGEVPEAAVRAVMNEVAADAGVGVVAVSDLGFAASATTQMAWAAKEARKDAVLLRADTVVWK